MNIIANAFASPLDPDWCVVEDPFDLSKNLHYESVFALGSGYLTTRASLEEGFENDDQSMEFDRFMVNTSLETIKTAKSKWGTYMPVIQGRHPFLMVGIVNLPYFLGLEVHIDGEKLDMETSSIQDYRRWLDLKSATLYRTLVWQTRSGKTAEIEFARFMNPADRFVCVQHCQIKMVSGSADVKVVSYIDNNVRTNGYDKFTQKKVGHTGSLIYSDVTTNRDNRIVTASAFTQPPFASSEIVAGDRRISKVNTFKLAEGQETGVSKISVVISDLYFPKERLVEAAQEIVDQKLAESVDQLFQRHCAVWAGLWAWADVEIDAEDREGYNSQQAIRLAIYHLLRAKGPDEERSALCPKGTTADTYFGSVFWDTDIFHIPYYVYTHPEIARSQVMFRYRTLPAARNLAQRYDYPGARYAWQSDVTGEETCVLWQYAEHQVHISADVAVGAWHYYAASGDLDFLFDYGAEIIIETARYWTSRVDCIPGLPGYQILGVMGPDEYKPLTNNNAYTNFVARLNLLLAVKTAKMMDQQAPERYRQLARKIKLETAELDRFAEIAAGISIPEDDQRQLIWQCDHFESDFAELDIEHIWKDPTRMFGSYVTQEKRYRSKCLKQADVVALLAIFPQSFTPAQWKACLAYYAPFTIHDSSNSMSHHAMVSAFAGLPEQAYEYWLGAIRIDFWKLPRSAAGIHMTNVAGMWQALALGFCGMSTALNTDRLSFNPCLPEEFHRIRFQAQWKGQRFGVTVTGQQVEVENLSDKTLSFQAYGKDYQAISGEKIRVDYARDPVI